MSFVSLEFIFIFFPLCVGGYYLFPKKFRNFFLLAASLIFYASGEPRRIYVLIVSITVNYVFGLLLAKKYRKNSIRAAILVLSILFNAGLLFGYKALMYMYGMENVIMPLGLSFYTFRTISYCLDIYWDMVPANRNIADQALYISFFPQISMGPISRYSDFLKDINNRGFDAESFYSGMRRITLGLFKKLIIADSLLPLISLSFGMEPSSRSMTLAWLGLIAYLIQLYFDFMGYTDIAIGIGGLFGFKLPENFNYPYASTSITEYWSRWHITLGEWARCYIYTPVFRACQGSKLTQFSCYMLASFCVWLFIGTWHGLGKASMLVFIVHGFYYYIIIAGERLINDARKARRKKRGLKKKPKSPAEKIGSHAFVIAALLFGQLLFNCDSMGQYGNYVLCLFGLAGNTFSQTETLFYLKQDAIPLTAGIIFSFPVVPLAVKKLKASGMDGVLRTVTPVIYLLMLVASLAFAFTSTYKSFVYFQF